MSDQEKKTPGTPSLFNSGPPSSTAGPQTPGPGGLGSAFDFAAAAHMDPVTASAMLGLLSDPGSAGFLYGQGYQQLAAAAAFGGYGMQGFPMGMNPSTANPFHGFGATPDQLSLAYAQSAAAAAYGLLPGNGAVVSRPYSPTAIRADPMASQNTSSYSMASSTASDKEPQESFSEVLAKLGQGLSTTKKKSSGPLGAEANDSTGRVPEPAHSEKSSFHRSASSGSGRSADHANMEGRGSRREVSASAISERRTPLGGNVRPGDDLAADRPASHHREDRRSSEGSSKHARGSFRSPPPRTSSGHSAPVTASPSGGSDDAGAASTAEGGLRELPPIVYGKGGGTGRGRGRPPKLYPQKLAEMSAQMEGLSESERLSLQLKLQLEAELKHQQLQVASRSSSSREPEGGSKSTDEQPPPAHCQPPSSTSTTPTSTSGSASGDGVHAASAPHLKNQRSKQSRSGRPKKVSEQRHQQSSSSGTKESKPETTSAAKSSRKSSIESSIEGTIDDVLKSIEAEEMGERMRESMRGRFNLEEEVPKKRKHEEKSESATSGCKKSRIGGGDSSYKLPLTMGWKRETLVKGVGPGGILGEVVYVTPCGKKLWNLDSVREFLTKTNNTTLSVDDFSFKSYIRLGDYFECNKSGLPRQNYIRMTEKAVDELLATITGTPARKKEPLQNSDKASRLFSASSDRPSAFACMQSSKNHAVNAHSRAEEKHKDSLARDQDTDRKSQYSFLLNLERERQRHQAMLAKVLEHQKKLDEKNQLRVQKQHEKDSAKQKRMVITQEQKMLEFRVAQELKKPVEDMKVLDVKALPDLTPLEGNKLSSKALGDCLVAIEFLHAFAEALCIDVDTIPTIGTMQAALIDADPPSQECMVQLLVELLKFAVCDPGIPSPRIVTQMLGQRFSDLDITAERMSRVLRMFVVARNGHEDDMSDWLHDTEYTALSADQQASLLAFVCDELLSSRLISGEVDRNIEQQITLRREKWMIDGKIRKLRLLQSRKFGSINASNSGTRTPEIQSSNTPSNNASTNGTPLPTCNNYRAPESTAPGGGGDDESGNESDETEMTGGGGNLSGDEEEISTAEELEKRIERCNNLATSKQVSVVECGYRLRGIHLGQDRYRRNYYVLGRSGGIYVEGAEEEEEFDADQFVEDMRQKRELLKRKAIIGKDGKLNHGTKKEELSVVKKEPLEIVDMETKEEVTEEDPSLPQSMETGEIEEKVEVKGLSSSESLNNNEIPISEIEVKVDSEKEEEVVTENGNDEICSDESAMEASNLEDKEADTEPIETPSVEAPVDGEHEPVEVENVIPPVGSPEETSPEEKEANNSSDSEKEINENDENLVELTNGVKEDDVTEDKQDDVIDKVHELSKPDGEIEETTAPNAEENDDTESCKATENHKVNCSSPESKNSKTVKSVDMKCSSGQDKEADKDSTKKGVDPSTTFHDFLNGCIQTCFEHYKKDDKLFGLDLSTKTKTSPSRLGPGIPDIPGVYAVSQDEPLDLSLKPTKGATKRPTPSKSESCNNGSTPNAFRQPTQAPPRASSHGTPAIATSNSGGSGKSSTLSKFDDNLLNNAALIYATQASVMCPNVPMNQLQQFYKEQLVKALEDQQNSATAESIRVWMNFYQSMLSGGLNSSVEAKKTIEQNGERAAPEPTMTEEEMDQAVQDELVAKGHQSRDAEPIPKEFRNNWWHISSEEDLQELLGVLMLRGIRERNLQKSVYRNEELVTPALVTDSKPVLNFTVTAPPCKLKVRSKRGKGRGIRRDSMSSIITELGEEAANDENFIIECRVLEEIEALEDRVLSASLQTKGWQAPLKIVDDDTIHLISHNSKKKSRFDQYPVDVARERLLSLEAHMERRYLLPPLNKEPRLDLVDNAEPVEDTVVSMDTENEDTVQSTTSSAQGNAKRLKRQEAEVEDEENLPLGLIQWRQNVHRAQTGEQMRQCVEQLVRAVAWDKSIMKVLCQICRRDNNEAQLLLCDGCDRGYHTYCFKPPINVIPEGDWFCFDCVSKATGKRHCFVCGLTTGNRAAVCEGCCRMVHPDCSKPPMSRVPRKWLCAVCVEGGRKLSCSGSKTGVKRARNKGSRASRDSVVSCPPETSHSHTETSNQSACSSSKEGETGVVGLTPAKKIKLATEPAVEQRMSEAEIELCRNILDELMGQELSWPFHKPVNSKQVPFYRKVIKKPMDFSTIKKRLTENTYKNTQEFMCEIRLVFDNCEVFNEDESDIGKAGHAMRAIFETKCETFTRPSVDDSRETASPQCPDPSDQTRSISPVLSVKLSDGPTADFAQSPPSSPAKSSVST